MRVNVKHINLVLFVAIQILFAAGTGQAQPYQTVNTEHPILSWLLQKPFK